MSDQTNGNDTRSDRPDSDRMVRQPGTPVENLPPADSQSQPNRWTPEDGRPKGERF
jgi:hypothetical protein